MKIKTNKKWITFLALSLFVVTGTYNAVVINSESYLSSSDVKFVKRLDEVYGVTIPGREVAATVKWQKLNSHSIANTQKIAPESVTKTASVVTSASDEIIPAAAVQEELSLSLVEVINPTKFKEGLKTAEFNGSLATNGGVIETLNVSLPNGEGLDVSFSEMTGNVFEYDLNGELYSGMMYQVDQNAYMVTLTNGPLEGTRMRFSNQSITEELEQNKMELASNNVEAGNFGNDSSYEEVANLDEQLQNESAQAQAFNFEQSAAL